MSQDDIKNYDTNDTTPFKWKKHLILPFFGIRNIEEVKNEIHRYKKQEIKFLIEEIKDDMNKSNWQYSYLISFVPIEQKYKIPNITIKDEEELEKFYKNFSQNNKCVELWFFKKVNNKEANNLVGRISFHLGNIVEQGKNIQCSQILEQVWCSNHREIEKYNENTNSIFLQASRIGWNRKYNIDKIFIPKTKKIEHAEILKDFRQVIMKIEEKREKIEEFTRYLQSLYVNELSLEYMFYRGKFSFIDWDSSNDKMVIDSIIDNRESER